MRWRGTTVKTALLLLPFAMAGVRDSVAQDGISPKPTAPKQLPLPGETFTVADCQAFLISPQERKTEGPLPWVWYAPTLPGLPSDSERWMFDKFLDAGIAIAGIDVGESYGSPAGRAKYTAVYDQLVSKRGYRPSLYCWGEAAAD